MNVVFFVLGAALGNFLITAIRDIREDNIIGGIWNILCIVLDVIAIIKLIPNE